MGDSGLIVAWSTLGTVQVLTEKVKTNEPVHEISDNALCAASKASDQPAHTGSLIRAFASGLCIL